MAIVGRGTVVATLLAAMLVAGVASADNNPNGTAFRAVGWFRGKGEISDSSIKCEVPTTTSAIADGSFAMGLWNTYGVATVYFPDINGPFANPCDAFGMSPLQHTASQDQQRRASRTRKRCDTATRRHRFRRRRHLRQELAKRQRSQRCVGHPFRTARRSRRGRRDRSCDMPR